MQNEDKVRPEIRSDAVVLIEALELCDSVCNAAVVNGGILIGGDLAHFMPFATLVWNLRTRLEMLSLAMAYVQQEQPYMAHEALRAGKCGAIRTDMVAHLNDVVVSNTDLSPALEEQ